MANDIDMFIKAKKSKQMNSEPEAFRMMKKQAETGKKLGGNHMKMMNK